MGFKTPHVLQFRPEISTNSGFLFSIGFLAVCCNRICGFACMFFSKCCVVSVVVV